MKELIENIDFYINEDGYMVLTEKYHLERDIVAVIAANTACINMKIFQSPAVHLYFPQIINPKRTANNWISFPLPGRAATSSNYKLCERGGSKK